MHCTGLDARSAARSDMRSAAPAMAAAGPAGHLASMKITAITDQARQPRRVNLFVDGEFRLAVALDVAQQLGLHAGDAVDEATLERAAAADLRWRAGEAAFSLLGFRARSKAEVRQRLLRKDFPAPLVDEILAELAERGYLDDVEFARAFVRDRTRYRPRGSVCLVQELRAHGVSPEIARGAIEVVFRRDGISDEELARAAVEAWLRKGGNTTGPEARRRLSAYLARRGFFGPDARAAIERVLTGR